MNGFRCRFNFKNLRLLMWKNVLIQWRHKKQTLVEILVPVIFTSLLVIVRGLVDPQSRPEIHFEPYKNSLSLLKNMSSLRKIVWSPQNPALQQIMDETVESILANENIALEHSTFVNSENMNKFLEVDINLLMTLVGIQFDDALAGNVSLPTNLDVTLRFPGELRSVPFTSERDFIKLTWQTNLLFPLYQVSGPRDWQLNTGAIPNYDREGFLKIQEEISYSTINYFKRLSGKEPVNKTNAQIFMRRFPYPEWVEDILLTALKSFVSLIIMLSFTYTCISTVKVITIEKERQLKEVMKIMGLPNWLHWLAWFLKSFIMMLLTTILIITILKAKWYGNSNYVVFSKSNPRVILLFLVFYICSTVTFCFLISVFFSKANTAAAIAGVVWFLSYFPYSFLQDKYETLSLNAKLFISLCSNSAMGLGFQQMLMFEGIGEGCQWNNIWKSTGPDDSLTLGHLMIMLCIDTVAYLLVTLYVEAIFPGDYGIPKPWYFIFTSIFRRKKCTSTSSRRLQLNNLGGGFFEKEPEHLKVGIKIVNLKKEYSKNKIAIRNLTINIYESQITVLLGHNGAGKSTTMSILSGLITPTSGSVAVGEYDITTDMPKIRDNLGLCPQHNILFDDLTVREHLYLYGTLKGLSRTKLREEINSSVSLLELTEKIDAKSYTLSGGMKRKLSVGVCLIGGSRVVLLDEPTAGMDPGARRTLWNFLQFKKKNRTILLTTHFMDEADLLGDRVAIMAEGVLQCSGSSYFLKDKYGLGYKLILEKDCRCQVERVTALIQKYIPDIQVNSDVGSELVYILNKKRSPIFEKMLKDLESKSEELAILNYGISSTTLEEVFIKVGAQNATCANENPPNEHTPARLDCFFNGDQTEGNVSASASAPLSGYKLWTSQAKAMFMKRSLCILRSWYIFVAQICIPVLFLMLAIVVVRSFNLYSDQPKLKMRLSDYGNSFSPLTAVNSDDPYAKNYVRLISDSGSRSQIIDWKNGSFTCEILEKSRSNPTQVRLRYIAGATFSGNSDGITVWFNNEPHHSPPLALQLVMNSILKTEVSPNHSIQIFNHPLPFTFRTRFKYLTQGHNMGFQIAFNVGFSMAFVSSFYIMFYIRERVTKFKHLQFTSGVNVFVFWASSFVCDLFTFAITSLFVIITLSVFREDGFKTSTELFRLFSVFLYFGFSAMPMMYLCSYIFDVPSTGYTRMTVINLFTGVACFLIVQVLASPDLELEHVSKVLHWLFLPIPHYSLTTGIKDVSALYATHKLCESLLSTCVNLDLPNFPRLTLPECKMRLCKVHPTCCSLSQNFYDWEAPGIGRNVCFSILTGTILFVVLLCIESRLFDVDGIINNIQRHKVLPHNENEQDDDIAKENEEIRRADIPKMRKYAVVIRDLTKYYGNHLAVNSLCLGLHNFECFGLLGVNGAGKTTTFQMMTGDIRVTWGDVWVNGYNLKSDMKQVRSQIGYCPQFDALLDDLTCRETLAIYCLIRGICRDRIKIVATNLARQFDFYAHLDKKVAQLSGGNKRKLSTAICLTGNPSILYLDEPTTGMDPATKRYLWKAICKVRDNGKCVVLTSHSMEECEALCTRLSIMVNGQMRCLGSVQHLRNKFSKGFALTIKLKKAPERSNDSVDSLEQFVKDNFKNVDIRERHQELITFYIADRSMSWSQMFGIMENAKDRLGIENYSLGQCSLEQMFLLLTT